MLTDNLNVLLADDDTDDCIFFREALDESDITASLTTVNDGVQLMRHLEKNQHAFPDIIYLDLNMPLKNGYDCLLEIKSNPRLKHLPVIVYSTCFDRAIADRLYEEGAHYYICKPAEFPSLKIVILRSIFLTLQNKNKQPLKEDFIIKSTTE